MADPAAALADVLRAIDRPIELPLPGPGTARLASEINTDWVAKFRQQTSH